MVAAIPLEHEERAATVAAHHMAGVVREFQGEMRDASLLLERARELHHPAEHDMYLALYGTDVGMLARAMSSRPLWALGYPDRALARARETLVLADALREPMARTFARLVLHGVLAYRGDAAAAEAIGEENIALCREHGLPQEAEWSRSFQGSALIGLGRIDEGLALLRDSVAVQQRLTVDQLAHTFAVYPSLSGSITEAARRLMQPTTPMAI